MQVKIVAIAIALLTAFSICRDSPDEANKALKAQGYTAISLHGYGAFSCGRGDNFSTAFRAVSPVGYAVEGVVCSGIINGPSIRVTRIAQERKE